MTNPMQSFALYEAANGKLPEAYKFATLVAIAAAGGGKITARDAGPETWLYISLPTGEAYDVITQLDGTVTVSEAEQ